MKTVVLLDTGAETSLIARHQCERLGLTMRLLGEDALVMVESVHGDVRSIGSEYVQIFVKIFDKIWAHELFVQPDRLSCTIILGMDFLAGKPIKWDFGRMEMGPGTVVFKNYQAPVPRTHAALSPLRCCVISGGYGIGRGSTTAMQLQELPEVAKFNGIVKTSARDGELCIWWNQSEISDRDFWSVSHIHKLERAVTAVIGRGSKLLLSPLIMVTAEHCQTTGLSESHSKGDHHKTAVFAGGDGDAARRSSLNSAMGDGRVTVLSREPAATLSDETATVTCAELLAASDSGLDAMASSPMVVKPCNKLTSAARCEIATERSGEQNARTKKVNVSVKNLVDWDTISPLGELDPIPAGPRKQTAMVRVRGREQIPPKCFKVCELEIVGKDPIQDGDYLLFPKLHGDERRNLMMLPAMVEMVGGVTTVILENHQRGKLHIPVGTLIGALQPVTVPQVVKMLELCTADRIPVEKKSWREKLAIPEVGNDSECPPEVEDLIQNCRFGQTLSDTDQEELKRVLRKNHKVFPTLHRPCGRTTAFEHSIDTTTDKPVVGRPYRTSWTARCFIRDQVAKMLIDDVIEPSGSKYLSTVVLVEKKDGEKRFCVNYKALNAITVRDVYPLPLIADTLDALAGAQLFISLDCQAGFWQVPVSLKDRDKTAFATQDGCYRFKVMPFGLLNSSSTYQRMMETILGSHIRSIALVYVDDVIIYGANIRQLLERLDTILGLLVRAGLTIKAQKCQFGMTELLYLGYLISKNGVKMDPSKVEAITNFPVPRSRSDVKSFLGLCEVYRHFIQNFATIAGPLSDLDSEAVKFRWTKYEQMTFERLKELMSTNPVLAHFDPDKRTEVRTDACLDGIGALALQDGRMVASASRRLKSAEKNYAVTELECLAVIYGVTKFRHYLENTEFDLITDHSALTWMLKTTSQLTANARVNRWAMILAPYRYRLLYRKGVQHRDADALSRHAVDEPPLSEDEMDIVQYPGCDRVKMNRHVPTVQCLSLVDPETVQTACTDTATEPDIVDRAVELRAAQRADPLWRTIIAWIDNPSSCPAKHKIADYIIQDGVLCRTRTKQGETVFPVCVPRIMVADVLFATHDVPMAGHVGGQRMWAQIRPRFYWTRMNEEIASYVASCPQCQVRRKNRNQSKPYMGTLPVGEVQELGAVDTLDPFKESYRGFRYVIVYTDHTSKFTITRATIGCTAREAAVFLYEDVVTRIGPMKKLVSDNGTQYTAQVLAELTTAMGVKRKFTTPYHPEGNSMVERRMSFLPESISKYVDEKQRDWDLYIAPVTFSYNTTRHDVTKMTPFRAMFGREALLPVDGALGETKYDVMLYGGYEAYVEALVARLRQSTEEIRVRADMRHDRNAEAVDDRRKAVSYLPGDKVLVFVHARRKEETGKLRNLYRGPYEVVRQEGPHVVMLKALSPKDKDGKRSITHVKPYYERVQKQSMGPEQLFEISDDAAPDDTPPEGPTLLAPISKKSGRPRAAAYADEEDDSETEALNDDHNRSVDGAKPLESDHSGNESESLESVPYLTRYGRKTKRFRLSS